MTAFNSKRRCTEDSGDLARWPMPPGYACELSVIFLKDADFVGSQLWLSKLAAPAHLCR